MVNGVVSLVCLADDFGRFGGTLLGPARFQHIETCAAEVCKTFKQTEELQDCITTLHMLDDMLGEHRKKLWALKDRTVSNPDHDVAGSPSTPSTKAFADEELAKDDSEFCKPIPSPTIPKVADYSRLDISKAKRLITARESSIKSVTALITKEEERLS